MNRVFRLLNFCLIPCRKKSVRSTAMRAKVSRERCPSSMWTTCWHSSRTIAREESTHEKSLVARGRLFLTEMNQSQRESDGETMTAILMKARDPQADLSARGPGQSYSLTKERWRLKTGVTQTPLSASTPGAWSGAERSLSERVN